MLQVVAGGTQGLQHDGGVFGREDGAEHVVQVLDAVPGQLARGPRLAAVSFGDPAVGLGKPFHLVGRHRCRHLKEILFGLRSGDPGERPDLRVGQPPRGELGGDGGQRSQRAGDADLLAAVPEAIWHFHDSHAAQDGISQSAQPLRASKSATSSRNWQVAAVRCPASSQIRASSRSIGSSDGPDVVATLMYSILPNGYDIPPAARFRGNAHSRPGSWCR